jgi:fructose-specific phosphotransferase system IIC component
MLPIVVFLGLLVVVSWLIEAEEEGVTGGILELIFPNPVVSIFMALVVVLLGNKINNGLQQQINAHDNK